MPEWITILACTLGFWAVVLGTTTAYRRRRRAKAFDYEYRQLAATTPLRRPADSAGRAQLSGPAPLSEADRDYYSTCWTHIQDTFAHAPVVALDLAEHLTVNLLLTRRLAPAGAADLPVSYVRPTLTAATARPFNRARVIADAARRRKLSAPTLCEALALYKQFFDVVMALPATRTAEY
jgi:hypothetical protein